MKKILKLGQSILFIVVILAIVSFSVFAQESVEPLPPPIEIIFITENVPQLDSETVLKLRATPLEDMHAEITCFLPEGIEPVREKGILVRPYINDRDMLNIEQAIKYTEVVDLWIGQLRAGITKEFSFRVIIHNKERYKLIARVAALEKWGEKEAVLNINME